MLPLLDEPEPLVPRDSTHCVLDIQNRYDFFVHSSRLTIRSEGGRSARSWAGADLTLAVRA